MIEKIHIGPADEDTKLAVQGVTREKPFRVAYDGMDGHSSESFALIRSHSRSDRAAGAVNPRMGSSGRPNGVSTKAAKRGARIDIM